MLNRVLLHLAVVSPIVVLSPVTVKGQPNVVIFFVDDMGYSDSSTYGSGFYETPNLDRLALESLRFTSAYAPSPVCSSSRAGLLTGKTPGRLHLTTQIPGVSDAGKPLQSPAFTKYLRQDEVTIAEALGAHGYQTAHIGKWHLGRPDESVEDPLTQGFDFKIGSGDVANKATGGHFADSTGSFGLQGLGPGSSQPGEYLADRLSRATTDYIQQNAGSSQPFFLYMSHYGVHAPYQGKPNLVAKYENKPRYGNHRDPTYAAMVESVDDALGELLDSLEDPDGNGSTGDSIIDDTIVIMASDNGGALITSNMPLKSYKNSNYEGGIRTPLLVRWHGHTTPGSVSDEPVGLQDLYSTLLDITGAPGDPSHNKDLDGTSLVPVLEGTGGRDGGPLYFHYPHYQPAAPAPWAATPHSAIRDGDWKLILTYEAGEVELYNLENDIGETTNLAGSNPNIVADLRSKLEDYLIRVDAQLPEGTSVVLPGKNMDADGVISINLADRPTNVMDMQEFAGVVHENHWNNVEVQGAPGGSGMLSDLFDGNGDATDTAFSFTAGEINARARLRTADYRMMDGWAGNSASDVGNAFSISGIPVDFVNRGYDVYVYFDSNREQSSVATMSFTIDGATLYGKELAENFTGFFVRADQTEVQGFNDAKEGNYVIFEDLHLSTFDLTVSAANGLFGTVNGIQIVRPFATCDFNEDEICDLADLDLMYQSGNLITGAMVSPDNLFDMDGDDDIDNDDMTQWLADSAKDRGYGTPFLRGDTDSFGNTSPTPRTVDITDFENFLTGFTGAGSTWAVGNFDGDSDVDLTDFADYLIPNFVAVGGGTYGPAQNIPEPTTNALATLALVGLGMMILSRRAAAR